MDEIIFKGINTEGGMVIYNFRVKDKLLKIMVDDLNFSLDGARVMQADVGKTEPAWKDTIMAKNKIRHLVNMAHEKISDFIEEAAKPELSYRRKPGHRYWNYSIDDASSCVAEGTVAANTEETARKKILEKYKDCALLEDYLRIIILEVSDDPDIKPDIF